MSRHIDMANYRLTVKDWNQIEAFEKILKVCFFIVIVITYIYLCLGTSCFLTKAIKWKDANTLWYTSIFSENDYSLGKVSKQDAKICTIYWGWSFKASKLLWLCHWSSSISICNMYDISFFECKIAEKLYYVFNTSSLKEAVLVYRKYAWSSSKCPTNIS